MLTANGVNASKESCTGSLTTSRFAAAVTDRRPANVTGTGAVTPPFGWLMPMVTEPNVTADGL